MHPLGISPIWRLLPACCDGAGMLTETEVEAVNPVRSEREFARNLLTQGLDPAALKAAIGKQALAAMMREWETARGQLFELPLRSEKQNAAD